MLHTTTIRLAAITGLAAGALAQTPAPQPQDVGPVEARVLTLGVYTSEQPRAMFQKFAPVTRAIEVRLHAAGHADLEVSLKIYKTYDEARDALVAGDVDFARFGPASYVLCKAKQPGLRLAAVEMVKGKTVFEGYIVVPEDSPAKTLADLRGARFAFGDRTSTIGRYLSQEALLNAGLTLEDLGSHDYLGRHDKVFHAVARGDFDAGALKDNTFLKLRKQNPGARLRVLARFDNVTKPWVVRAGLEDTTFHELQRALLELDDDQALKTLKVTGFASVEAKHFQRIHHGMAAADRFCQTQGSPATPGKD